MTDGGEEPAEPDGGEVPAPGTLSATVQLEQFKALRQEMLLRLANQNRIVFFNLVATASIFGVVLTQKVTALVLLVVPPLSASLGFAWLDQQRMLALMGQFVRKTMWRYFESKTGEALPNWEGHWYEANPSLGIQLINSVHPIAVFVGPGAVSLIMSLTTAWSTNLIGVWAFDLLLCVPLGGLAWWRIVRDIRPRWTAIPPVKVRSFWARLGLLRRKTVTPDDSGRGRVS